MTSIARNIGLARKRMTGLAGVALLLGTSVAARAADTVDFSGTWKVVTPRTSILPDRRAIAFTPQGKKQYDEHVRLKAKKDMSFDLTTSRCSSPGMPRVMLTPMRLRIFQDPQVMTMGFEWNRVRRAIAMPGLPPQISLFGAADDAKLVGTKMGTAQAQWDGGMLVITTKDLSDSTLLDDLVPHGFGLKVTERLTLKDADTLEDRIMIEDPEYFAKPLETVLTYKRQPDAIFPEDVCLDRMFGKPPLPTK
ncbi:hypothetical protein [Sphingobium sp. HWE2-09]|uniref:hypothetical protein n=1 Tax=Sphingobium sp. HWE2-09 TaxID=3108390 RepID=UPI002DCCD5C5|nr:hypothetical protein [Sphingobium sp. HWE2-09]